MLAFPGQKGSFRCAGGATEPRGARAATWSRHRRHRAATDTKVSCSRRGVRLQSPKGRSRPATRWRDGTELPAVGRREFGTGSSIASHAPQTTPRQDRSQSVSKKAWSSAPRLRMASDTGVEEIQRLDMHERAGVESEKTSFAGFGLPLHEASGGAAPGQHRAGAGCDEICDIRVRPALHFLSDSGGNSVGSEGAGRSEVRAEVRHGLLQ